jgi:hypothetical protein
MTLTFAADAGPDVAHTGLTQPAIAAVVERAGL